MADERSPDDTYEAAVQQQHAEHHEDGADEPVAPEMLESMRAHDETGADLPVGERERNGGDGSQGG